MRRKAEEEAAAKAQLSVPLLGLEILAFPAVKVPVHSALPSSNQSHMHAFSALGLSAHWLFWNAAFPTRGALRPRQALC